jgi:hypothetical protein
MALRLQSARLAGRVAGLYWVVRRFCAHPASRSTMSRLFRFLLLFPLVALTSFGAGLTPEQEHLNHYVGEWDGTLTNLPNAKVRITCEWILSGTFLRHSLTFQPTPDAPPMSVLQLMTYDTTKQVYRAWSFYSNGSSVQGEGAWDAAASTFTWTNRDEADGTTTITKVSFPDADSESTFTQIKNRAGQVISEIRGTKTRRK